MSAPPSRRARPGPEVYVRRRPVLERFLAALFLPIALWAGVTMLVLLLGVLTGRYPADTLARSSGSVLEGPSADQELIDLWDWGLRHGYVAEAPGTLSDDVAVPPSRTTPVAVDPAWLQKETLHLRAWHSARGPSVAILTALGLVLVAVVAGLLNPTSPVDTVGNGVALLFFGTLTALVVGLMMSTTRIDTEGFHVRSLGRVDAPWPRSRSDLYVHVTAAGRFDSDGSCVLLLPDGRPLALPGTRGGRGPGGALRAWETSERIWAWGVAHGVAHDDGAYRPCADLVREERRRLSQEHLAAERERLSARGGPAPGPDGTA